MYSLNMLNTSTKSGFLLIEILLVISIISLFSITIFAVITDARKKASDSTHIQALNQLKTAINLYYEDNGNFPHNSSPGYYKLNCWDCVGSWFFLPLDNMRLNAIDKYLPDRPQGTPSPYWSTFSGYYYKVSTDRQHYKLTLVNTVNAASIPYAMKDEYFIVGSISASIYSDETSKIWEWNDRSI